MFKKSQFPALLLLILTSISVYAGKGPGDKVEDFTLKSVVDGTTYTLNDVKDSKALVVMFWSTECPYVQPYTDRINEIANNYSKQGVTFWAVNSNTTENYNDVKKHMKERGYVFPVLKDDNNVFADQLGATRTPEIFLISSDRTILYHGRIDDNRDADKVSSNDLRNALEEFLTGKEISTKNTKSFGCGIKRSEK